MKLLECDVRRCIDCLYHLTPSDDKVRLVWCYKVWRLIEDDEYDFPAWCPLPEKKVEP